MWPAFQCRDLHFPVVFNSCPINTNLIIVVSEFQNVEEVCETSVFFTSPLSISRKKTISECSSLSHLSKSSHASVCGSDMLHSRRLCWNFRGHNLHCTLQKEKESVCSECVWVQIILEGTAQTGKCFFRSSQISLFLSAYFLIFFWCILFLLSLSIVLSHFHFQFSCLSLYIVATPSTL